MRRTAGAGDVRSLRRATPQSMKNATATAASRSATRTRLTRAVSSSCVYRYAQTINTTATNARPKNTHHGRGKANSSRHAVDPWRGRRDEKGLVSNKFIRKESNPLQFGERSTISSTRYCTREHPGGSMSRLVRGEKRGFLPAQDRPDHGDREVASRTTPKVLLLRGGLTQVDQLLQSFFVDTPGVEIVPLAQ